MWGVKINQDRSKIKNAGTQMLSRNHYMKKGYDQELLRYYLWPVAQSNIVYNTNSFIFKISYY